MDTGLRDSGYLLDASSGIWSRPDYAGIAYSDGDATEVRMRGIIAGCTDRRLFSGELHRAINDWPTRYHLSATRANIIRPFAQSLPGADVLEIGAGCGAITRFLGESGARVLALEGSPRRAGIARIRTADLPEVSVVADNFEQFKVETQFDFVTLIGVLEYAGMFLSGQEPARRMLERALGFLKPGGSLILAIENQLGLKYLAGAPEDHIRRPMYGVEDRYRSTEPRTFGLRELTGLLSTAGFGQVEIMAPFPDYKFPFSVVTQAGLAHQGFDAAAIVAGSILLDPQLTPRLAFSPELAWPVVTRNGLALDLANSFLIRAAREHAFSPDPRILAHHYSTNRQEHFCKESTFLAEPGGPIEKRAAPLKAGQSLTLQLTLNVPPVEIYREGALFFQEWLAIVTRSGWKIEQIGDYLRRYRDAVAVITGVPGVDPLPGQYFDLIPRNIIVGRDGSFTAIDQEWSLGAPIEFRHLLFRALHDVTRVRSRIAKPADSWSPTLDEFFIAAFDAVGLPVTSEQLLAYAAAEASTQAEIGGRPVEIHEIFKPESPLRAFGIFEAYDESVRTQARLKTSVKKSSDEAKLLKQRIRSLEKSPAGRLTRFFRRLRRKPQQPDPKPE